jgi:cell division protein FtsW
MALRLKTDWILFATIVAVVFFGAVMVYSASSVMAELKFGSSYYFVFRQVFWVVAGIVVLMLMKRTHYRKLQQPAVAFTALSLTLILLLAVYFIDGHQHRWIRLGPLGQLQPSELAKPALIIFLAFFIALRSRAINNKHTLMPAALAVGFVAVGVVVADLGTAVVLMLTAAAIFYVAGIKFRYFAIAGLIAMCGVGYSLYLKPYRLRRVVEFVDHDYKIINRLDKKGVIKARLEKTFTTKDTNYQSDQAKIAVGVGGVLGQGITKGRQKLLYLPEAHTDEIYAVVGEELGLLGCAGVVFVFVVILWRGIRATVLIPDDFGRYLALGVTTMIVVQAFINMTVVLGLAPTKGIPLPMISYGGSSLVSTMASLGLLLNISEHAG